MSDREWLSHGPASINLLLSRQSERDKLLKICASVIAGCWVKDATLGTFFPEFKEEEERAKRAASFENIKARIEAAKKTNARRKRKLENRRVEGATAKT